MKIVSQKASNFLLLFIGDLKKKGYHQKVNYEIVVTKPHNTRRKTTKMFGCGSLPDKKNELKFLSQPLSSFVLPLLQKHPKMAFGIK
jgi:hypothetical protein